MERAGCAAGDQASGPGVGRGATRRRLVRRLRVEASHLDTRAAPGPALGTLRSLCEVLADGPTDIGTRKRGPELGQMPKRRLLEPLVERREASMPIARHAPRLASVAVSVRLAALRSPHFGEAEERGEGMLGAHDPGRAAELWLFDNRIGEARRSAGRIIK